MDSLRSSTNKCISPSHTFELEDSLASGKLEVLNLKLCKVLLNNDRTWPWLVLVPMKDGLVEIHDLSEEDQVQLVREISACSKALSSGWSPTKINVGALGCVCRQLHVHVLGRYQGDRLWPGPVWGSGAAVPYENAEVKTVLHKFKTEISRFI